MKKRKVNYVITHEFKDKKDLTEEELKEIFNKKYFNYIIRREKSFFDDTDDKKNLDKKSIVNK